MWGASTSAHQVEGGTLNQWSVWEPEHASQLAKSAHKRLAHLPIWDEIKNQAQDPANYISGRGVDHYRRYRDDFDIAESLNLNAFRFSFEWSRLEPEEGQWDAVAIEHYKEYIRELKARGLKPFATLWHSSLPVWFAAKGGFAKHANLRYFDRYIAKIADEFVGELDHVVTINEPNVYTTYSYLVTDLTSGAAWPPGERNFWRFGWTYWNLTKAHRRAYKILKLAKPSLRVGVSMQLANIQAKRPHDIIDELSTKAMRYAWNWWFLFRIRRQQDFIGLNYYFSDYYSSLLKTENPSVPVSDMGWYMEPEGLYPLLLRAWAHFGKPIFITESGVADQHDQYRRWWIEESIIAMERALSEGVKLEGYFHWSLLDNFEWTMGWWPKFGLVQVDCEHGMKRTVRASAQWFAEKIESLGNPEH